jgi:hypothetical protein
MAALHETAEPLALKGVHDVVSPYSVTASARPAIAKGGEGVHPDADAAGVMESLVVKTEGGSVGDCIKLKAPGLGMLWRRGRGRGPWVTGTSSRRSW